MSDYLMRMPICDGISAPRMRQPDPCCAPPYMPAWSWSGVSQTPPALLAQALTDREDDPPFFRSAMNDLDEPAQTETLVPPTDREAPTNPENEKPEPRQAMNPPPAIANPFAEPPPWWEGSFFQATFNKMTEAAEAIAKATTGQDAVLQAIQRAERSGDANWKATQHQIETWRKTAEAKDAEQDDALAMLRRDIEAHKGDMLAAVEAAVRKAVEPFAEKLDVLERAVEALERDAKRAPTAPTPPVEA